MADPFGSEIDTMQSPATDVHHPVQSDTANLATVGKGIRFNAAGTVKLQTRNAAGPVTLTVLAGESRPWRVLKIWDTGTSLADSDMLIEA